MTEQAEQIRQQIVSDYRIATPESEAFHVRAEKSLVAGVTGNLRFFKPYPLYFESGEGAYVTDIDGNRYIDCFLCNGPHQLGHKNPAVLESIRKHESTGALVVNPRLATEAAEKLIEIIPCAERVRFVTSGTEAVMTAIRVARAATGKTKVIKFLGHYHGQSDQFLAGLGVSPKAMGDGIPESSQADTILLPYGDSQILKDAMASSDDISAVLLDPAMHSGGLWGSNREFLEDARRLTEKNGTLLVFDEVITGFRLALGGAQEYYGVTPDLATFAKALCAGEKLGAIAGKAEVMAVLDPRRNRDEPSIFQSGTTNDGTSALAAAVAALDTYRKLAAESEFDNLIARVGSLKTDLESLFASHSVPAHINQLGPMLQLFLADVDHPDFESLGRTSTRPLSMLTLALIKEGVLFALPGSTHVYFSFRHGEEEMHAILRAFESTLDRYDFGVLVGADHR